MTANMIFLGRFSTTFVLLLQCHITTDHHMANHVVQAALGRKNIHFTVIQHVQTLTPDMNSMR